MAPVFFIPLATLIVFLVLAYSPQLSVAAAIICLFIVSSFQKETRFTPARLRKGIIEGAKAGAQIAACSATIGFIIGSLTHLILTVPVLSLQETHFLKGLTEMIGSLGVMFSVVLLAERYWLKDLSLVETALSCISIALFCLFLFGGYRWGLILGWAPIALVTVTQLRGRTKARAEASVALAYDKPLL